jgi:hypothetical protein
MADGINLGAGPGLERLLDIARSARIAAGGDAASFIVTVSSDLRAATLSELERLDVHRVVVFVRAPFAENARRLADARR